MQHREPDDIAPAPITLRRVVGKTLVGSGVAAGKYVGPLAATGAIAIPVLMASGVTSMTIMVWVLYGKTGIWDSVAIINRLHKHARSPRAD